MYDPQQEDIWQTAIRVAESVQQPPRGNGKTYRSRGPRPTTVGFRQAKQMIITALREAQKESLARRYPLIK